MAEYDGVIIGAGPNGLAAGAYLAKAGLKVIVLDRRCEAGGGLATEEITLPGFYHNVHAIYMMMVDYAPPYKDLMLEEEYGVKHIMPSPSTTMLFSDGRSINLYPDVDKSCESIGKISQKDADTYREVYHKYKDYVNQFLAPGTYYPAMAPFEQMAKLQATEVGREINMITEQSPKEIVDDLYENERVKALMLYIACMWGLEYDSAGVSYLVPLLIDRATCYRLAVGGSHTLAQSLGKVIYDNGGLVLSNQPIKRIIVEDGKAKGVELEGGQIIKANKFVASSLDPIQTFIKLVGKDNLSEEFAQRIQQWKWEKWSLFSVHMALEEPPGFSAASYDPMVNQSFVYIVGYDSDEDLIEHWKAIEQGELVESGFNCSFPSMHDPSQAPPGRCTGLISEFAPFNLKEGGAEAWYRVRDEHAEQCVGTLRRYATNLNEDSILWKYISTPLDIQNKFHDMVEGSIKQGAYQTLQMGYLRPNEMCEQNRTPIENLYLCGASSHSGGMVTFGPAYVASNIIAEDLGIQKWWSEPEIVTQARERGLL